MVADEPTDVGTPDRPPGRPRGEAAIGNGAEGAARAERLASVWQLAELLDSRFRVPGTSRTFGLDALVGLIPGIGGGAGLVLSGLVILRAIRAGAQVPTVVRMLGIAGLDAAVGSVPVLGSAWDFVFKANVRNARILQAQALDPQRTAAESRRVVALAATAVLVVTLAVTVLTVAAVVWLLRTAF